MNESDLPPSIPQRAALKRGDFMDLVAARTGGPVDAAQVDAALATIGEVLESGRNLSIPPLGQIKVIKEKSGRAGHQLLLRLTVDRGSAGEG